MSIPRPVFQHPVRPLGLLLLLVGAAVGGTACGSEPASDRTATSAAPQRPFVADSMTVPRMLATDDRFSILRAALDSTGLDSVLATGGPFTLFAPPNEAFAGLPPGRVDALLADDQEQLRTLLTRHIVGRRVPIQGRAGGALPVIPMSGDTLSLRPTAAPPTIGDASLLDSDIEASNGLLHVVDTVLRPPDSGTP